MPAIAWWPGVIPAGTSSDAIVGMFDILPTFAYLAGVDLPSDRKLDGMNIFDHLTGKADGQPAHETFYYFRGLVLEGVRHGDWKLRLPPGGKGQPQLYNLRTDIGESTDLAKEHPEVVAKLRSLMESMKEDLGLDGIGPGCRPLGRVNNPEPLIGYDGKIRPGFEARSDK